MDRLDRKSRIPAIVGVILLIAIIGAIGFVVGIRSGFGIDDLAGGGEYEQVGLGVVTSIRKMADLTTVEYVEYTTVEKGKDGGLLDFAIGDRIFLFAVARIGAGIDLRALGPNSFTVDPNTGRVQVVLPPASITYVAMDNEATQVYDRDTGLFTKGDPDLERAARITANESLRAQALDAGILHDAEDQAAIVIREFLQNLGYPAVVVEVEGRSPQG